ncbi:hypothetical protein ACLBW0_08560 [Enterobacteriaceae bacterium C34A]
MTTITQERLQEIRDFDTCVTLEESAEMARMLLVSMGGAKSAAAVTTLESHGFTWNGGEQWKPPLGLPPAFISNDRAELQEYRKAASEAVAWLWSHRKHASEVTLTRPEDDERAEPGLWSGWTCQPLAPVRPAPVVPGDIGEIRVGRLPTMNQDEYPGLGDWWVQLRIGEDSDEVLARVYGDSPQEANNRAEALACRAAMLQAEPVSNRDELPDGWVMVPKEPTEHMIVEGFESWPDEFFSDTEVWEAYQEMSGCQQAAHRAKLCWAAMIAAAPQQEVK